MLLEMRGVLTPEQRRQLAQLRDKDKRKRGTDPASSDEKEGD